MTRTDRADALLEGIKRKRRVIVSPEGIPLDVRIAAHGERLTAFVLDMTFMTAIIVGLYLSLVPILFSFVPLFSSRVRAGMTLVLFTGFIVRNLYFLHFELAWQGRTPGKKICGLRVIARDGGALTPSALIARNITREVEFFLPLSLCLTLDADAGAWRQLSLLAWTLVLTFLPLFNRDHLRAGDLIGGTQVIAVPRRVLLDDLTLAARARPDETAAYVFTPEQLAIYGAFELQVLEEILRRPATRENDRLMADVCLKICRRTGREETISPEDARRFLNDFYAAERAELERGQLFGRFRADKTST
ncbi:MAG: RDD family protein [Synergistaceae bacterium]|jgi:uncharacterized RDD family membrane protein YckC|nr:RDD family protein [Synergistaceae bacterium]